MTGDTHDDTTDRDPVRFGDSTPLAEWAIALVGAAIVAAVLAVLLVEGLTVQSSPPAFHTTVVQLQHVGDQHLATIDVTNVGGRPASDVVVEGQLRSSDTPPVTASIDYLPTGGTGTVGLLFDTMPAGADDISTSVSGFQYP